METVLIILLCIIAAPIVLVFVFWCLMATLAVVIGIKTGAFKELKGKKK